VLQEGLSEEVKAMIAQRVNAEVRRRHLHHPIAVQSSSPYFRSITLHLHHTISVEWFSRDEPQVAAVRAQLEDAFKQKEQEMRAKIEGLQRSAAHWCARARGGFRLSGKCARARISAAGACGIEGQGLGVRGTWGGGLGGLIN